MYPQEDRACPTPPSCAHDHILIIPTTRLAPHLHTNMYRYKSDVMHYTPNACNSYMYLNLSANMHEHMYVGG